ncbi:MAG: hypothetical protein ACRELX_02020 [Longimicrobiales bacterium]
MKKGGGEPLRFRGMPGSLSAAVREGEPVARRVPIRFSKKAAAALLVGERVARASRLEGDLVLQLTLPPRTPPGTYEAVIDVGGRERPVVIEVEPEIELQIVPDQLTLRAAPGEHATVDLTFANTGNVAVEIRRAYAFGIFAAGGLERALHRTYVDERAEGERRVDYLFDRLAEEHGGLVRIAIEEGSGELKPGDTREVRATFRLPERLARGRTYTGTWPLHDVRYYIRLVVPEGKETPAETR